MPNMLLMRKSRFFLIGGIAVVALVIGIVIFLANQSPPAEFEISPGKEIGVWVWDDAGSMATSTMSQLIESASKDHFTAIYLTIDPYLNIDAMPAGAARDQALKNYEDLLYNFISLAHQKNIAVDAEAGEADWGQPGNSQKAYDILSFVSSFNASHDGKFRGVQYDVESYLLSEYGSDPAGVLTGYVSLVKNLADQASATQLPLSVIVPYFYTSDQSAPQVTVNGVTDYPYNQIIRSLEELPSGNGRAIVLAYRNTASGTDGAVALAAPEVHGADATSVKVLIAQETGNVQPSSVTFYGMAKADIFGAVRQVDQAFSGDASYGGIAVDYLQTFEALR